MNEEILPGARVLAFDIRLYVNDIETPLLMAVKPATVIRRYGFHSDTMCNAHRYSYSDFEKVDHSPNHDPRTCCWNYPDLVDVRFDHRPEDISGGHFTDGVQLLEEANSDN